MLPAIRKKYAGLLLLKVHTDRALKVATSFLSKTRQLASAVPLLLDTTNGFCASAVRTKMSRVQMFVQTLFAKEAKEWESPLESKGERGLAVES